MNRVERAAEQRYFSLDHHRINSLEYIENNQCMKTIFRKRISDSNLFFFYNENIKQHNKPRQTLAVEILIKYY
jgi:hypothetical protein